MQRTEHMIEGTYAYRFVGPNADHALLVIHGMGGHGGIYDEFCAHHASRGVDVWSIDLPGHGRSAMASRQGKFTVDQWVDAAATVAAHIHDLTGLSVVAKGSSLGVTPAYALVGLSPHVIGAVLMGYAVPGTAAALKSPWRTPDGQRILAEVGEIARFDIRRFIDLDEDYGYKGALEQKETDPLNSWFFDLASYASLYTFDPVVSPADNTAPILFTVGEHDPIAPPAVVRLVAGMLGGPVEVYEHPGGVHQLMMFHTREYSPVVADWCRAQIAESS